MNRLSIYIQSNDNMKKLTTRQHDSYRLTCSGQEGCGHRLGSSATFSAPPQQPNHSTKKRKEVGGQDDKKMTKHLYIDTLKKVEY